MNPQDTMLHLAVALAIGILIGAERHWRERDAPSGSRMAGIRTFALSGLLGGAAGVTGAHLLLVEGGAVAAGLIIGLTFSAFSAALIVFGLREAAAEDSASVTNVVAGMITFALGTLAVLGDQLTAAAGAVAVTALLASREALHGFVRKMEWREFRAAIVILAMTFLILPLTPSTPVGPWGGIDPRELWTLGILMAVISFAGYIAVKLFGAERGLLIAGAAGGLSSSTAVTLAFARQAKATTAPGAARQLAAGALIAGAASTLRAAAIAIGIQPSLAIDIGAPSAGLIAVLAASAGFLSLRAGPRSGAAPGLANPFHLAEVLRFTALLAVVFLLVRALAYYAGETGVVVGAAITGLIDVHAVSAATPAMAGAQITLHTAALAVLCAFATSTLAKMALALAGGRDFFRPFALYSALSLLIGGAIAAFVLG